MTAPANSEDERYQKLQDIYLKWHSRRRPLSGFICELKAELEQAEAAARTEADRSARIDQTDWLIRALSDYSWGSYDPINLLEKELAQLRTDAGGGMEK